MKHKIKYLIIALTLPIAFSGCSNLSKNQNANISTSKQNAQSKPSTDNTNIKRQEDKAIEQVDKNIDDNEISEKEANNENNDEVNNNKQPNDDANDNSTKEEQESVQETASNVKKGWYFMPNDNGTPPTCDAEGLKWLKEFNGYYLGDTSKKVIYLTFDEGYENGYSSKILDILKENDVKAAFFVTTPYIKANKDLIKRMVDEGHIVGNHSTTHPSMPTVTDINKFNDEILTCAETFKEVTGKDMPKFFRPPMGEYSETSLKRTNDLGYKTIFWSFAYKDWDKNNQPSPDYAKETILKRTHNGAIMLLHAVSKTNTEVLDDVIKEWKNQGYTFKTLEDLPERK